MIPHRIPHRVERFTVNAQIKAVLVSWGRTFFAAALAQYILLGKTPFTTTVDDLKVIVSAGVAALVLVVFNAINPKDRRYGRGAPSEGASGGDVATNVG